MTAKSAHPKPRVREASQPEILHCALDPFSWMHVTNVVRIF